MKRTTRYNSCLLAAALALATAGLADPGGKGKAKKSGPQPLLRPGRRSGRRHLRELLGNRHEQAHVERQGQQERHVPGHAQGQGHVRDQRGRKSQRLLRHGEEARQARQRRRAREVPRLPERHGLGRHVQPERDVQRRVHRRHDGLHRGVLRPGAKFTCLLGYAGCKFNFEYSSPAKSLVFHHWQDKGTNGVSEQFIGDIANS